MSMNFSFVGSRYLKPVGTDKWKIFEHRPNTSAVRGVKQTKVYFE